MWHNQPRKWGLPTDDELDAIHARPLVKRPPVPTQNIWRDRIGYVMWHELLARRIVRCMHVRTF